MEITRSFVERTLAQFEEHTGVHVTIGEVYAAMRGGEIETRRGCALEDSLAAFLDARRTTPIVASPAQRTAAPPDDRRSAHAAATPNRALAVHPAAEAAKKAERARITAILSLNGPAAIKDKAIDDGITPAAAAARIRTADSDAAKASVDQYLAVNQRARR
jgi:hypothetical protein